MFFKHEPDTKSNHDTQSETAKDKVADLSVIDAASNNVVQRANAIAFDVMLPSSSMDKSGNKRRKSMSSASSNITHTIPTIPSVASTSSFGNYSKKDLDKKYHSTLSFSINFPHSNDTVFLSYCYPFSYTELQGYLHTLQLVPVIQSRNILRRQLLCRTRLGNKVDLLTVTNFNSALGVIRERPIVILSARVHPGEVNASWIMKGIIDFLLSKNHIAYELRNRFVFKIIPCLNPDGVVCGNHRCGLSGVDLNRQYMNPSQFHHPSIYHLKRLVSGISADSSRKIFLVCDLHGHSQLTNITFYGCAPDSDLKRRKASKLYAAGVSAKLAALDAVLPSMATDCSDRYKIFAYLLTQRAPKMFSYEQCLWHFTKQKEGTARVVFWREFNVQNTFTMESSYCGSNLDRNMQGFHFNTTHFLEMGAKFCAALYDLCSESFEAKNKVVTAIKYLKENQVQNTDANGGNHRRLRSKKKKRI